MAISCVYTETEYRIQKKRAELYNSGFKCEIDANQWMFSDWK